MNKISQNQTPLLGLNINFRDNVTGQARTPDNPYIG